MFLYGEVGFVIADRCASECDYGNKTEKGKGMKRRIESNKIHLTNVCHICAEAFPRDKKRSHNLIRDKARSN